MVSTTVFHSALVCFRVTMMSTPWHWLQTLDEGFFAGAVGEVLRADGKGGNAKNKKDEVECAHSWIYFRTGRRSAVNRTRVIQMASAISR